MGRKMSEVKKDLLLDKEFHAAYVGLEDDFALAAQLIDARKKGHLTQDEMSVCGHSCEKKKGLKTP